MCVWPILKWFIFRNLQVLVVNLVCTRGSSLFSDDWEFERATNTYYLGNVLHIEASVIQYNHVPLRVFAHSCVATAVPDVNASPRYSFIENYG